MEKEIIKRHDFEKSKNEIKKFVENKLEFGRAPSIKMENEYSILLWKIKTTHNITGSELAEQMCFVHDKFIDLYKSYNDVIRMFSRIYDALETLDKDYINGILSSIKSADEASKQAIDASNLAKGIGESAQVIGREARELGRKLEKVVGVLELHDKELQKSKHIRDVDELWIKVHDLRNKTERCVRNCETNEKKIKNIVESSKILFERENRFRSIDHLEEIDNIWNDVQGLKDIAGKRKKEIDKLHNDCDNILKTINDEVDRFNASLRDSSEKIRHLENKLQSINHIDEIDSTWEDVQGLKYVVKNQKIKIDILYNKCDDIFKKIGTLDRTNEEFEKKQEKRWKYTKISAIALVSLWIISMVFVIGKVG